MNKIVEEDIKSIIQKADFISKLNNKNILLIGGTGFFAKWFIILIDYLNNVFSFNISLTITIRSYKKFVSEFINIIDINKYQYIESDIENLKLYNKDFDFVLYFASPDPYVIDEEKLYNTIAQGTENIVNIFENANIERLIFTSSGAVYGCNYHNSKETDICKPNTIYAKAKKYAEELILQSNINISIARCFVFNGPFNEKHNYFAMANFIDSVINNRDIIINGDGSPIRSYLYMADAIYWLLTILLKSKNKSIYNVGGGGGGGISIYDLAKKVAKQNNNYTGEIKVLGKTNIGVAPERYVPDISKIIKELGVKENYTLEAAIKRTIEYYKGL